MRITLPVGDQKSLTFTSFDELAQHYSNISNAYMKTNKEKALAYGSVAWQLSASNGFKIE